jgi:predicted Holliday junction resolvase-like endonuclease
VIPLFDTVDYLVMIVGDKDETKDGIYFVEIKTGNGDLSTRQRKVRNLVRQNRVHFITHKADRMEEFPDES